MEAPKLPDGSILVTNWDLLPPAPPAAARGGAAQARPW
jgi:hypothetical protein